MKGEKQPLVNISKISSAPFVRKVGLFEKNEISNSYSKFPESLSKVCHFTTDSRKKLATQDRKQKACKMSESAGMPVFAAVIKFLPNGLGSDKINICRIA